MDYYLAAPHTEAARRIAVAGYLHCMRHHRAANLVDYALRTLHVRQSAGGTAVYPPPPLVQYSDTGYDMQAIAIERARDLKEGHKRKLSSNTRVALR